MKTASSRTIVCAALLGLQLLGACASWQPARVSPTVLAEADNPDKVRVRQTDGTTFVLHDPRLVSDTLVGNTNLAERRVPLASVAELAVRKVTTGGVVAGVIGIVVVVGLVATLYVLVVLAPNFS